MITVLYHANCNDGFCAAWVMYTIYGDLAQYIPVHYGQSVPDVIKPEDDVIIVDFSYKRDVLLELKSKVKSLVVVDHHKTAQEDLKGLDFCIFDMDKSGAVLTWETFKKDQEIPSLVQYVQDRDLWKWELPCSKQINCAISLYEHNFKLWTDYLEPKFYQHLNDLITEGQTILNYEKKLIDQHVKHAVEVSFAGEKILAVNATVLFSDIAGTLAKDRPFGIAYFRRQDGKYQFSLRSDKNGRDVSEIAKAQGGGGHKHAAGFELSHLPF